MPHEQKVSYARSGMGILLTRVLLFPMGLITSLIIARLLGAEDLGVFALSTLFTGIVLPLCSLGMGAGIVYQLSSELSSFESSIMTCLLYGVVQGVVAMLLMHLFLGMAWLGEAGGLITTDLLMVISLTFPLLGIQMMMRHAYVGIGHFHVSNRISLLSGVVQPVLMVVFVIVFEWDLLGAFLAVAVTAAFTLVYVLLATITMKPHFCLRLDFLSRAFIYGVKTWPGTAMSSLNLRFDQFLIASVSPAASLGNYSLSARLSELPWLLADGAGPVFFKKLVSQNTDEKIRFFARVHRILFTLTLLANILLGIAIWFLAVPVFGPDFKAVPLLTVAFLVGSLGFVSGKLATSYFGADARPELTGAMGVVGGLVSIVLYVVFIPLYGLWGGVIGSVGGYVAQSIISMLLWKRVTQAQIKRLFVMDAEDLQWLMAQLKRGLARQQ